MAMAIHQLAQTTICADDFQDNMYSFPVDSVLSTESAPGKLVVSTSEGYLLTTSFVNQPKREQSLTYKKQADGKWAVHGVITIIPDERGFPDGMVRIQHSQAGTTILTIQGESTALAPISKAAFLLSETTLSFGQTALGQPKSLVFSISQQEDKELITISSDAPEYFLVATDKHPNFTASLSVKPSLIGTYVHVRYLAKKAGTHTGQLLIQSAFEEQAIALSGRTTKLLPTLRSARSSNAYVQPVRRKISWLKIAVILSVTVVAGLAWFGFMNRHLLLTKFTKQPQEALPNEKTEPTKPNQTEVETDKPVTLTTNRSRHDVEEKRIEPQLVKKAPAQRAANEEIKTAARTAEQPPINRKESVAKPTEPSNTKQYNKQGRPVQAVGESELEKELNQATPNPPN